MGRNRSYTVCAMAALAIWGQSTFGTAGERLDAWKGRYAYVQDSGRTVGGSAIVVDHELAIAPTGQRGGCLLSSRGFQSDDRIVCHIEGDGTTLAVTFHGYPDGKLVNRYGVAVYKPGQRLFTLKRVADGSIETSWEAFRPDETTPAVGTYFAKVK